MSVSIEDIRKYCKDLPEYNILLEGKPQSSDELIELAMALTVNDFNVVPPVSQHSIKDFPSDTIMIYGVLHHLYNAEASRQLANQVNYSAQGINAGIDDKHQQYLQLAQTYKTLFEQKIGEYKQYINMEQAWGGSDSPYSCINEWKFRD